MYDIMYSLALATYFRRNIVVYIIMTYGML